MDVTMMLFGDTMKFVNGIARRLEIDRPGPLIARWPVGEHTSNV
jgi:hypothetical protein